MKTLPILVATALIVGLALVPIASASGSITFSSPAAGASYKGVQSYSIAGTVSPAPGVVDNVFITVKNPSGVTVDAASVPATPSSGSFSYATATGGSTNWNSGTYTITATDSYGATGTTTFTYTAAAAPVSTTGLFLTVQAVAATPDFPGQTVQVTALVSFSNGTNVAATWSGSHYHDPSGAVTVLSAPTSIGPGMYMWTITLPSNAANGLYSVHLRANASGFLAWGVAGFTVNTALASSASQNNILGNLSALSAVVNTLSSTVNGISSTVGTISSTVGTINTAVSTISTNVGTILSNLNSLTGTVSTISSNVNTIQSQLPSAGAISTTQTYVLVVAVLAAITVVLELAVLVRKLS